MDADAIDDSRAIDLVARTMVSLYGSQAVAELRRRAAAALDAGDMDSYAGWQAILHAAKTGLSPLAAE
jgi:hypothetical protein